MSVNQGQIKLKAEAIVFRWLRLISLGNSRFDSTFLWKQANALFYPARSRATSVKNDMPEMQKLLSRKTTLQMRALWVGVQ